LSNPCASIQAADPGVNRAIRQTFAVKQSTEMSVVTRVMARQMPLVGCRPIPFGQNPSFT
jgi:hypothetical protein